VGLFGQIMNANKNAKRILIYGDSYVFGKIPGGGRFDSDTRFTGLLQKILGEGYEIVEEGLRGRMIDGENAFFPYRNGFEQFGSILGSHLPLDMLAIFLGTNDTNSGSRKNPQQIVDCNDKYLDKVNWWCEHLDFPKPIIMIIAPPIINERESYKTFKDIFKNSEERSRKLPNLFETYAKKHDLAFFDSSKVVKVSPIDGIHLNEGANRLLAKSLANKIEPILKL